MNKNININLPETLHKEIYLLAIREKKNTTQPVTELVSAASKIVPEYDGNPQMLQRFVDALEFLNTMIDEHMLPAVRFIKTRLKGTARNRSNHID